MHFRSLDDVEWEVTVRRGQKEDEDLFESKGE
jgi:hypothetical protein